MKLTGKNVIDVSTNIIVITVALLIGWQSLMAPATQADHIKPGTNLPQITGYTLQPRTTMVLVLRQGCHFCEASMPFYQRLSQMHASGQLQAQMVALFPDPGETGQKILSAHQVDIPAVANADLSRLHVEGTPTIFLVDSRGKIEQSWLGQLGSKEQDNVVASAMALQRSHGDVGFWRRCHEFLM